MSTLLMAAVWDLDIPQTETLILMALANYANDEGVCCSMDLEKIAHRSRRSVEAVADTISQLKRDGWMFESLNLFEDENFICLNVEKIISNRGAKHETTDK